MIIYFIYFMVNRNYVAFRYKDKGVTDIYGIPVNYNMKCSGSVVDNTIIESSPNVDLSYECNLNLYQPIDEEMNQLKYLVDTKKTLNQSFNNATASKFDDSLIDFDNMSNEEVYTKKNTSYINKKVRNVIPGSKQDRINKLGKELPDTANGIDKSDVGRGVDAYIPEQRDVTLD